MRYQGCSLWTETLFSDQLGEFDRSEICCCYGIEECVYPHCTQKATVGVWVTRGWEATEIVIDAEVNKCVSILQSADARSNEIRLIHHQRSH